MNPRKKRLFRLLRRKKREQELIALKEIHEITLNKPEQQLQDEIVETENENELLNSEMVMQNSDELVLVEKMTKKNGRKDKNGE